MKTQTPQDIALAFGCTADQVRSQFAKNRKQLTAMRDKARSTGRKVNGHTAEKLDQLLSNIPA